MTNEEVVTKDQGDRLVPNEVFPDHEGLGDAARGRLFRIGNGEPKVASVAEESLNRWKVARGADDQDFTNPTGHKGPDWVVDHRLVVHGQELLADALRGWVEATPAPTREHDPFHRCASAGADAPARLRYHSTVVRSASSNECSG